MNRRRFARSTVVRRTSRRDIISHFLDDDEVRDEKSNPSLYQGPFAAFTFSRIEVRNFAAWKIASILKMKAEPDEDWNPARWAELRARTAMRWRTN